MQESPYRQENGVPTLRAMQHGDARRDNATCGTADNY